MGEMKWPTVGDVILVQDMPTTDAQRERWANRQPPTKKGEVVEVPKGDGSGFLTIDVGGEYGGVTYAARDFGTRYTWKLVGGALIDYLPAALERARRESGGPKPVRDKRTVGLTKEQADGLLMEIRDRAKKIRSGWVNPQYGTCIEEETDRLLEALEKLDASLTAGFPPPTDWE